MMKLLILIYFGWLHDEIVDSYLFLLELKFSHVLDCGYVEARAIVAGKSMKCLWKTVIEQGVIFCSLQSFRCSLVVNCIKLVTGYYHVTRPNARK